MANVIVKIRCMPKSIEVDLNEVKDRIKDTIPNVRNIEEKPIAFGLKALMVETIIDDSKEGTTELEEKLGNVYGIGDVVIESASRAFG